MEAPSAALEYARRLAQNDIPVNSLVRAYRLGQTAFFDQALVLITRRALAPELKLTVAHRIFTVVSGYIDWISQQVIGAYEEERSRWQDSSSGMRAVRVREILAATEDSPAPSDLGLGYGLDQYHLALILWSPEHRADDLALGELERAAHSIAEHLGAVRPPLFVAVDRLSAWTWIPLGERVQVDRPSIARKVTGRGDRLSVAAGRPASGHRGFRTSHEQAKVAQHVAMLHKPHPRRVTFHEEPGLAVADLLAKDLDGTRAWVLETLGPLAADSESAARSRETLRAYLNCGSSHKAAAASLNLHYNTVKYRVRKAEQELGAAVADNRLAIELAVLACHWLGRAVLSPGATFPEERALP
ncbi:PucR family transcriptional regulator [Streptomyces ochraceiscleroticus]|uniref:PucR family transcriptional regulator n=1 Tax=Streptomyces ochraceiscleroticus TaxID=47761 RepID=A0ABW1MJK4_9ACTN|nr:helix-turn-helix domain-containing protein [Streptomyces ochraceiscleroticus]